MSVTDKKPWEKYSPEIAESDDLKPWEKYVPSEEKKNPIQNDLTSGTQTSKRGFEPFQTPVDTKTPSVLTPKGKTEYQDQVKKEKDVLSSQLKSAKQAFSTVQGEDVVRDIELYQQDPEAFRFKEDNTWLGNAIKQGLLQGEIANTLPTGGRVTTPEDLSLAADINYQMAAIPQSDAQKEYEKSGLGVFKNPLLGAQFLTETIASSLAALYESGKRTVPTATATGAGAGVFVGGIGAIAGAGLGVSAGLSVAGLNLSTSGDIMQSLKDSGVDITDKDALIKAFSDENKMSEIRTKALKYGVPILAFDMASAGIAGKLIGGAAGKSVARKIAAGFGEAGTQSILGSAGELAGQVASGKNVDWNEVALEGIASLATDAPDVAIGALTRDKASSSNKNIATQINKLGVEDGVTDAKINLDRDLNNGVITPKEYEEGILFVEKAVIANDKIPAEIQGDNREQSIELIAKKDDVVGEVQQLSEQKQKTDDSYHPIIDEQIKEKEKEIGDINKQVQELAKPTIDTEEQIAEGQQAEEAVPEIEKPKSIRLNMSEEGLAKMEGKEQKDVYPTRQFFENKPNNVGLPEPDSPQFDPFMSENKDNTKEETVDLSEITPTQELVDKSGIGGKLTVGNPKLVRFNDGLFVLDGHHRISTESVKGNAKIKADVTTIDMTSDEWGEQKINKFLSEQEDATKTREIEQSNLTEREGVTEQQQGQQEDRQYQEEPVSQAETTPSNRNIVSESREVEEVNFAKSEIEKGAISWDGDRFSPRPDLGIEWTDIRKGQKDILAGKDTVPARRLIKAINKAREEGGYTFIQGSGGIVNKMFVPISEAYETPLTSEDIAEITANEAQLAKEYDEWFNNLSEEEKNQELNFNEDENINTGRESKENVSNQKDAEVAEGTKAEAKKPTRTLAEIEKDQKQLLAKYHDALKEAGVYEQAKNEKANPNVVEKIKERFSAEADALKAEKDALPKESKGVQKEDALGKPDLKLKFASSTELVNSKDPIGNREKHNEIKEKFKALKNLINCL